MPTTSTADKFQNQTGRLLADSPGVRRLGKLGWFAKGVGAYRIAKGGTNDVGDELECAR